MFSKLGILIFPEGSDEDAIMEAALEAGADDVETTEDGIIEVVTSVEDFQAVKDAMEAAGLEPEFAEVTMKASTTTALTGEDAEKVVRLQDALEDLDDVQEVFTNADIPDEVLDQLG
jgi:transcriptional/translational regulatory protein YebC/TACO1